MKLILLSLLFAHTTYAGEVVEALNCDHKKIEIKSDCSDRLTRTCRDQVLKIDTKTTSLKDAKDESMWAESWACAKGKSASYLIVTFNNGGNCDECEVQKIYDLNGKLLTATPADLNKVYKDTGLPAKVPMTDFSIFPKK